MSNTYRAWLSRGSMAAFLMAAIGSIVSCQTYHDAQGNPVQAVDPAAATSLTAAGALAGAAIANNNNARHHNAGPGRPEASRSPDGIDGSEGPEGPPPRSPNPGRSYP